MRVKEILDFRAHPHAQFGGRLLGKCDDKNLIDGHAFGEDELDSASIGLAAELAGNAPLSQIGNKRVIAALLDARDGLAPEVLARSHFTLALSRLTLPHALVRVLLAEQLYRAHCILTHHPYHRA